MALKSIQTKQLSKLQIYEVCKRSLKKTDCHLIDLLTRYVHLIVTETIIRTKLINHFLCRNLVFLSHGRSILRWCDGKQKKTLKTFESGYIFDQRFELPRTSVFVFHSTIARSYNRGTVLIK